MPSINNLPTEILVKIFEKTNELKIVTSVCKLWRSVAEENLLFETNKFFTQQNAETSVEDMKIALESKRRFKDFIIRKNELKEEEFTSLCSIMKKSESYLQSCTVRLSNLSSLKLLGIFENLKNIKKLVLAIEDIRNMDVEKLSPVTLPKLKTFHSTSRNSSLKLFAAPSLETFILKNDEFEFYNKEEAWKFINENGKNINQLKIFGESCNIQWSPHRLRIKMIHNFNHLQMLDAFCMDRYDKIEKILIYNFNFEETMLDNIFRRATSLKELDFRSFYFDFSTVTEKSPSVKILTYLGHEISENQVSNLARVFPNVEELNLKSGGDFEIDIEAVARRNFRNLKDFNSNKYL